MGRDLGTTLVRLDNETAQSIISLLDRPDVPKEEWEAGLESLEKAERVLRDQSWSEAGCFNEEVAQRLTSWQHKVWMLGRAIIMNFMANDMKSCVRCHRAIRQLAPRNLPPRQRMAIWRPAGVVMAYSRVGAADEARSEIRHLASAVEQWSLWERWHFHLGLARIAVELCSWDEAIAHGREFVAWALALADDSPELLIGNVSVDGTIDFDLWRDAGRWYAVCEMFAMIVVWSEIRAGGRHSLHELLGYLFSYEARWVQAQERVNTTSTDTQFAKIAEEYKGGLAGAYAYVGWMACEAKEYQQSLSLLRRQEELSGGLISDGLLYRAVAMAATGDMQSAKDCLVSFSEQCTREGNQRTRDGRAIRFLEEHSEFDILHDDLEFQRITMEWR